MLKSCEQIFNLHIYTGTVSTLTSVALSLLSIQSFAQDNHSDSWKHYIEHKFGETRPAKDQQIFRNTSRTVNRKQAFFQCGFYRRWDFFHIWKSITSHTFQSHHFNNLIEEALHRITEQ